MSAKYLAGDFPSGTKAALLNERVILTEPSGAWTNATDDCTEAQAITEENKGQVTAKAGWALAGLAAFGPLGALAGVVFGGRGKEYCVVCTLKDGRRAMLAVPGAAYQKLIAQSLLRSSSEWSKPR